MSKNIQATSSELHVKCLLIAIIDIIDIEGGREREGEQEQQQEQEQEQEVPEICVA